MRPTVLKVVERAGVHLGNFTPAQPGDYLVSLDVDARGGRGEAVWSPDKTRAMVFADPIEAMRAWTMQSRVRPYRDDGKPNRPLTAYTVETEDA
jgi:hypothetical protein